VLQGEVIEHRFPSARRNTITARDAAAQALAAYLSRVLFEVAGSPSRTFQLKHVLTEWPESFDKMVYPSAAITSPREPIAPHNFRPTALEETWDVFCPGSVLWKTGELAVEFQVDFWCTTKPEREAVAARLDEVFSPTESRSGVLLQGPDAYWCRSVRCTLIESERIDSSASTLGREREYRAKVLAELDLVQLREAAELQPVIRVEPPVVT
jgi:hypothetical protein